MVVYLVGAGPGDPELITVKANRLLQKADVILYDRLVHPSLLALSKPECKKYYVGKKSGCHHKSQEEINKLLLELGKSLDIVVRLKGGDPFLFGRGGEEAEVLANNGISFEIVPGVSAALAVPAYAGIPITHRFFNSQFAIVTGHESKFNRDVVDFEKFPPVTIILMSSKNRKEIVKKLTNSEQFANKTPVAIITHGTLLNQKVIMTTVEHLDDMYVPTPALIVVGEVVKLRNKLKWFDTKLNFLANKKKILIPHKENRTKIYEERFKEYGAEAVFLPIIELIEKETQITDLDTYDVLVFTSKKGVEFFCNQYSLPTGKKYFAIGPTTQCELKNRMPGVSVFCPTQFNSIALGNLMLHYLKPKTRILLVRSANASSDLRIMLEPHFEVKEISIYEVIPHRLENEALNGIDIIFITAGSVARALIPNIGFLKQQGTMIVSIGPITSSVMQEMAFEPDIEAQTHTIEGMIWALVNNVRIFKNK